MGQVHARLWLDVGWITLTLGKMVTNSSAKANMLCFGSKCYPTTLENGSVVLNVKKLMLQVADGGE